MALQSRPYRYVPVMWAVFLLSLASSSYAQIPSVTDTTFTPTPNAGHDYIESLNETVNPANGALSIRVGVPMAKSRGLNIPFHFAYDTNGVFSMGTPYGGAQWQETLSQLSQGGWSYAVPMLSIQNHPFTGYNTGSGVNDYSYTCDAFTDYVFQDSNGGRANLGLMTWDSTNVQCNAQGGPPGGPPVGTNLNTTYSEYPVLATTDVTSFTPEWPNSVNVTDADGTVYNFSPGNTPAIVSNCTTPAACTGVSTASQITDRNGNSWQLGGNSSGVVYVDSIGRTALHISSFGAKPDTVTVGGLTKPYLVNWQAVNANYAINMTFFPLPNQDNSRCTGLLSATHGVQPQIQAVSSISLPNGQSYTFDYSAMNSQANPGSANWVPNPYGLVDKITYPTGGYVRYVWGLNPQATFFSFIFAGPGLPIEDAGGSPTGQYGPPTVGGTCEYEDDVPAILQRFVSYDGVHEVEEQDFSYAPTTWAAPTGAALISGVWATKQTTVITKDLVRNTQHQTIYNYVPTGEPVQPNSSASGEIPVESLIQSFDNDGTLIETVSKNWRNERLMTQQITSLAAGGAAISARTGGSGNGPAKAQTTFVVAETDWQYNSNEMMTEKDEYDYGFGARGNLLRKTVIPSYDTADFNPASHIVDKPNSVQVLKADGSVAAGVTYHYDSKGNLTTRSNWLDQTGTNVVTTSHTYDLYGNLHTTLDPNTNTTTYNYTDSPGTSCSGAFLASIVYPTVNSVKPLVSFTHDCTTGELIGSIDENSQPTYYHYGTPVDGCNSVDYFNRLTETDFADGGKTFNCYNDAGLTTTTTELLNSSGQTKVTAVITDAFGHALQSQLLTDPAGPTYVDTTYDGEGRVYSTSNPYRSSATAYTYHTYDGLSRPRLLTHPDNSTQQWFYLGNSTTSTDEASNSWTRTTDALGRLLSVLEPGALPTGYTYDALGNLISVTQSGTTGETPRVRSFTYDSLSRLTSSNNPETGIINYSSYDGNGNLLTKTDARNTITYTYDALNRLTSKRYSDGSTPAVFGYDGFDESGVYRVPGSTNSIGRLTRISTLGAPYSGFGYDVNGRLSEQSICLPSDCDETDNVASATYDYAGNMTSLTYPDGRQISQSFDTAGRLSTVGDSTGTTQTYVQSILYNPDGTPGTTTYGNGIQQSLAENNRLQIQTSTLTDPFLPSGQSYLSHTYCYSTADCSAAGSAYNKGNIWQIADNLNGTRTQSFTYDALNRIRSFVTGAGSQTYNIDSFGNSAFPVTYSNGAQYTPTFTTNNQILAATHPVAPYLGQNPVIYDPTGNLLYDMNPQQAPIKYTYDAENRIVIVSTMTDSSPFEKYIYGGDGTRVRKDSISNNASTGFTEYFDFADQPIAEKDQTGGWTDYVYANGKKIARIPGQDTVMSTSGIADGSNWAWLRWDMNTLPQNPGGGAYTIKAGDRLCFRQSGNGVGGPIFQSTNHLILQNLNASDGQLLDQMIPSGSNGWVSRCIDISIDGQAAGENVALLGLMVQPERTPGNWQILYSDMSITSTDGTVTQIPLSGQSFTFYPAGDIGSNDTASVTSSTATLQSTHYFLADQLGTTQLELSAGGWPVWRGEFAPFGQELDNQATANHYKFTGKERDVESGLDYFGARYYGSSMGRFMSPDWAAQAEPVPYAKLDDPQSLNLYSYVLNNPLSNADADGHAPPRKFSGVLGGTFISPATMLSLARGAAKGLVNMINFIGGDCSCQAAVERNTPTLTPSNGTEAAGMVIGGLAIGPVVDAAYGGSITVTAEAGISDAALSGRANAIQAAQDAFGQTKSTTAAASVTDANGNTSVMVGSSRNALTPSQRAALQSGETAVTGTGHAETTVINAAQSQGMTVNSVAASRPICANCAQAIQDAGARAASPLKQP